MMNKTMSTKPWITLFLVMFTAPVFAQMPDIQEGLWEVSTEATIPGMPMKMPAMTTEQCFTKQSMNPENILQQNNCQMHKMDIQSNQASWSMTCEQEGMTMQGSGNIQYQKTQFSGTFDLVISGAPEGAMSMQTKLSGRYIGQCPK
ncbi:conserved hypothetical protein, secreted [methanotrophic bacterial endosymbiont of Bathymodiolus sp.]|nr:conserved hypothetical protein, secreted [methanotrophic bacterial endosymbiont of Bathymodiolus sp.]